QEHGLDRLNVVHVETSTHLIDLVRLPLSKPRPKLTAGYIRVDHAGNAREPLPRFLVATGGFARPGPVVQGGPHPGPPWLAAAIAADSGWPRKSVSVCAST